MEKEQLINCLRGRQRSLADLAKALDEDPQQVENQIKQYLDTGVVVSTIKGYMLLEDCSLYLGTIVLRKDNFAYIMPYGAANDKKNDVRVAGKSLEGYIIGDKVYFQVDNWKNGTIAGLYKRTDFLTGTIFKAPNGSYMMRVAQTEAAKIDVVVEEDLAKENLVDGDLIKAKVISSSKDVISVSFDSVLAKASDVGADISAIIASNDAPLSFPSDVTVQAQLIPQEIDQADIKNREDFRDDVIVTIDGEDALDFDDAVSCTKIQNGYQIGVYIADVSYYVRPNTPLDREAQKRGTSIYVADRVVPMLPKELSNGICSLNPHVDRFVLSVIMNVDEAGNVYRSVIKPGVINSHGRLTYQQVNDLFAKKGEKAEVITSEISDMLMLMKEATSKIRLRREKNGALDLDSTELKFNLDEKGNPTEVIKREQGEGEKMIEDLMIIANVEVAKFLSENHIPTLYRVHDNPPSEKLALFMEFLKNMKLFQDFPKKVTSASLSHWYSSITDEKVRFAVSGFLLRSLAKAKYTPDNSGHFGLAEEFYLHFTSPIRRYPDLIVHRTLRDYVFHKEKFNEKVLHATLVQLGLLTSETERKADIIEREVDDLEACKYMSNHLGEQFTGTITGITGKGMYLELDNGIEVFNAISDIDPSQKWVYSEKHMDIQGTIRDETDRLPFFRLGAQMKVIIDRVTFEDKTIHSVTITSNDFRQNYTKYMSDYQKERAALDTRPDYKRFKDQQRRDRYGSRFNDDDYGSRRSFDRDDQDGYSSDRRSSFSRDDRGGYSRGDRPSFNDRPSRGGYSSDRRGSFSRDDRGGFNRGGYSSDRRSSYRREDGSEAPKANYSHRQADENIAKKAEQDENAALTRFVSTTDSQDTLEAKRKFYSDRPMRRPSSRGGRPSFNDRSSSRGGYSSDRRGSYSRDDRGGRDQRPSFGSDRPSRDGYSSDRRSSYSRDDRGGSRGGYSSDRRSSYSSNRSSYNRDGGRRPSSRGGRRDGFKGSRGE